MTLNDSGTVSLASSTEFGNNGTAASVLTIGAGKVFDITAANVALNDNGSVNITNAACWK